MWVFEVHTEYGLFQTENHNGKWGNGVLKTPTWTSVIAIKTESSLCSHKHLIFHKPCLVFHFHNIIPGNLDLRFNDLFGLNNQSHHNMRKKRANTRQSNKHQWFSSMLRYHHLRTICTGFHSDFSALRRLVKCEGCTIPPWHSLKAGKTKFPIKCLQCHV